MTTAFLHGYYGRRNTGDDAFVAVSAWGARRYLGCDAFVANATELPLTRGTSVRPLYWSHKPLWLSRWFDRRAAGHAASIVFGGGSNFHTRASIEHRTALLKLAGDGRHCAVGVSIGPFRDAGAEEACADILRRLSFVGVRDVASLARAKSLAPDARIELTFDLAPLLPLAAGLGDPAPVTRRGLGIALCNLNHGDASQDTPLVHAVAAAIGDARESIDELVLIDFNGDPFYGDTAAHRALAALVGDVLPVRTIPYASDPVHTWQAVSGVRAMLSMRLHAGVFAFCTSTPSITLSYQEKCREWATLIGAPANSVFDTGRVNAKELSAAIRVLLTDDTPMPALSPAEAQTRALRNWTWTEDRG
jgi:polysaccharide pyruvyl transferase WcaK-like protein